MPFLRNIGISLISTHCVSILYTKIVKKAHDDKMRQSKEEGARPASGKWVQKCLDAVGKYRQSYQSSSRDYYNPVPSSKSRSSKFLPLRQSTGRTENPRPIKVLFKDEDDKWAFLKRVNEVFKDDPNIYCLKDRPKEVRDHEYELRKATRALREENPSK